MNDPIAIEKQAWEEYDRLRYLIRADISSVIEKGGILKRFRDTGSYEKLGDGGYETWSSFLQDGELGITRKYALQHIQMYEFYVLEMGIPIEEIVKLKTIKLLRDCMVYINGKNLDHDQAMEVIEKAKVLSYADFFREMTGRELSEPPQHALEEPTPTPISEVVPRPDVEECTTCHKARIRYSKQQICNCDDVFHILETNELLDEGAVIKENLEGSEDPEVSGADYQHETSEEGGE